MPVQRKKHSESQSFFGFWCNWNQTINFLPLPNKERQFILFHHTFSYCHITWKLCAHISHRPQSLHPEVAHGGHTWGKWRLQKFTDCRLNISNMWTNWDYFTIMFCIHHLHEKIYKYITYFMCYREWTWENQQYGQDKPSWNVVVIWKYRVLYLDHFYLKTCIIHGGGLRETEGLLAAITGQFGGKNQLCGCVLSCR